ncbi:MAG: endopeptidase La [Alphaproteobacteria bacterium]
MFTDSSTLVLPILPLRNIVVFPGMVVPLLVGREKSITALEEVMDDGEKQILLVTQKNANTDNPAPKDVYEVGTVGTILQLLKLPDGTVKVLIEATERMRIVGFTDEDDYFEAEAQILTAEEADEEADFEVLERAVTTQFEQYVKLNQKIPDEIISAVKSIDAPGQLVDAIAAHVMLKIPEKQALLELLNTTERLERLYSLLEGEMGVFKVEKKIKTRVKKQMEKNQREYYLNEQLKAIQKELNKGEDEEVDEITEYDEKINKSKMSKEAKDKAFSELKKLKNMSQMSAEAGVIRGYLDWLLDVPWKKKSRTKKDLLEAEAILEEGHYGLEKVKERIVEFIAVQIRKKKVKGPILCLVGPPGVGKTSLGKSVAEAVGRNFARISLGGMRDEAEIRGHRRTYVGAMPGKIMQTMKKVGSSNPLILLDEIDKLGSDWRGDPSSALLEVLDPEQNGTFNDHYMEVDYDLSDVLFVTTANTLKMPRPLLDRMEIIHIPGYTEEEKFEIAKRYLIPKQLEENGLEEGEWSITNDAIYELIRRYTREAGVRGLERGLGKLARKALKEIIKDKKKEKVRITLKNIAKYLGPQKYKYGEMEEKSCVGVTTGLAWTQTGGELLLIEAVKVPGKGKVTYTGKLGDVMKESIQAAEYFVKSRCIDFGIKPTVFKTKDIHIHLPEGAIPKDGPSAGIAMIVTIVSVLTGIAVRNDVAMTGEMSLRGRALPIGGLKEKLLAALRGGIKTVIIPEENEKDLEEIPDNVKKALDIRVVSRVEEALNIALVEPVKAIEWVETEGDVDVAGKANDDAAEDDDDEALSSVRH